MNTDNKPLEPETKAQSAGPLRRLMDRLGRRRRKAGEETEALTRPSGGSASRPTFFTGVSVQMT